MFSWFLGEYFEYVDQLFSKDNLLDLFNYLLSKNISSPSTFSYILNSLKKIQMRTKNADLKVGIKSLLAQIKPLNIENKIRLEEYK